MQPESEALGNGGKDYGTRRYLLIGLLTIVLLIGGIGGWSVLASINGAVIAGGNVVVESHSSQVQHAQGGIIGKIAVSDGDHVKAGDLLIRLDDTVPAANLGIIQSQLDELVGRQSRLLAEQSGKLAINFPDDLADRIEDPDVLQIVEGQVSMLKTRRASLEGQRAQLIERVGQLQTEIKGLTAQRDAKATEIELIAEELEGLLALAEKKLIPKSRVVALQREAAQLQGDRGRLISDIARAEGRITETKIQIIQLDRDRQTEVAEELRGVQTKIAELSERRVAALDQLRRIDIRAPLDGVVHQMAYHTIGGVVPPGQTIMQVVPVEDLLIIEAKLNPADIDQIYVGQSAIIRFPGLSTRTTPDLNGEVIFVSADVKHEQALNLDYYEVRIRLAPDEIKKLGDNSLVPGMPAEVFAQTDARTPFSYLTKPLFDQMNRAMREH